MSQTKAQLIDPTDGSIVNADINASAAIAGTKVSPDFGSQNIVTTGSVGIGIGSQTPSTPQKQLHIAHDSSPRIMLSNDTTGHATPNGTELLLDSNGNFEIFQRENLNVEFFTNGSQRMTINGSGDIGIGTTSPNEKLVVQGNSSVTGALFITSNTSTPSAGAFLYRPASNTLALGSNSAERMRIDSSGNVGIGTTAPVEKLGVDGGIRLVTANGETNRITALPSGTYSLGVSGGAAIGFTRTADGGGGSDQIIFETHHQGTSHGERMRIDKSGNVGIGTTTPDAPLVVRNSLAPHTVFKVNSQSESTIFTVQTVQDSDIRIGTQSNHPLTIYTNQIERMRVDTSGRLIMGTTTQFGDGNDKLMIENGTTGAFVGFGSSAGFAEPIIGSLRAYWADNKKVASINFFGGTDTTNKDDGSIRFNTSAANNLNERMRINSNGYVSIGTTDNSYPFHVKGGIVDLTARFENTKSGNNDINYIGVGLTSGTTGVALFGHTGHSTSTSQAAWIGNAGDDVAGGVGVRVFRTGKVNMGATGTSNNATLTVKGVGVAPIACTCNSTSGHTQIFFVNGNGNVGQINTINSETRYFTTSDYRLKENVVDLTGAITRLKTLQPKRFNWISDETNTLQDGFLAHEVTAVPEAISGTKDKIAVQADVDEGLANNIGDPVYQSIDHSKLVPLLVAALKELTARVETLEAA